MPADASFLQTSSRLCRTIELPHIPGGGIRQVQPPPLADRIVPQAAVAADDLAAVADDIAGLLRNVLGRDKGGHAGAGKKADILAFRTVHPAQVHLGGQAVNLLLGPLTQGQDQAR